MSTSLYLYRPHFGTWSYSHLHMPTHEVLAGEIVVQTTRLDPRTSVDGVESSMLIVARIVANTPKKENFACQKKCFCRRS